MLDLKNIQFGRYKLNLQNIGTQKPVFKAAPQSNIAFGQGLKLKTLTQDTVSFKGYYFKPEDIHNTVRKFSDGLIELSKKEPLTKSNVSRLINKLNTGVLFKIVDVSEPKDHASKQNLLRPKGYSASSTSYLVLDKILTAMLIDFDSPQNVLISDLTHEFTHILQFDTMQAVDMIYNKAEMDEVEKLTKVIFDFEKDFLKLNHDYFEDFIAKGDDNIKTRSDREAFANQFDYLSESQIEKYDQLINRALSKNGLRPSVFYFNFLKMHALNESQAYSEAGETYKSIAQLPEDRLLLVEIYPKVYKDLAKYYTKRIEQTAKIK